jgi:hypothetical protein
MPTNRIVKEDVAFLSLCEVRKAERIAPVGRSIPGSAAS